MSVQVERTATTIENPKKGEKMGYFAWANKKIREELDYTDVKMLKIMAFCVGVPVGAYFSKWVLPYWWVFIILSVVFHLRPWYHALRKPSGSRRGRVIE